MMSSPGTQSAALGVLPGAAAQHAVERLLGMSADPYRAACETREDRTASSKAMELESTKSGVKSSDLGDVVGLEQAPKKSERQPKGQSAAAAATREHPIDTHVRKERNVERGPCAHCGIAESPQWRRGPPEKSTLCNACGTRFLRTKNLGSERQDGGGIRSQQSSGSSGTHRKRSSAMANVAAVAKDIAVAIGTSSGGGENDHSVRSSLPEISTEVETGRKARRLSHTSIDSHTVAESLLDAVAIATEERALNEDDGERTDMHPVGGADLERKASTGGDREKAPPPVSVRTPAVSKQGSPPLAESPNGLSSKQSGAHDPHREVERRPHCGGERTRTATRGRLPGGRFIGVTCAINRKGRTWQARIRGPGPDGRERAYVHLGMHSSPDAAAKAFDRAALVVHGVHRAVLNFPLADYAHELDHLRQMTLPQLALEYRCRPHSGQQVKRGNGESKCKGENSHSTKAKRQTKKAPPPPLDTKVEEAEDFGKSSVAPRPLNCSPQPSFSKWMGYPEFGYGGVHKFAPMMNSLPQFPAGGEKVPWMPPEMMMQMMQQLSYSSYVNQWCQGGGAPGCAMQSANQPSLSPQPYQPPS